MDINQILKQTGGLDSIARELGIDKSTAQSGAQALLPEILAGFGRSAQGGGGGAGAAGALAGLGGLGSLIGALGGGGLLDSVTAPEPTPVSKGNDVLGEIFGSKDVSRSVAADASQQTGISPDLLKKMLPILAMVVAGYMAKKSAAGGTGSTATTGSQGGLGDILGGLLGGLGKR